jgi:MFS family permease
VTYAQHAPGSALADVVRLRPFRRLWLVFGLSSLGDWLGLLATSTFASARLTSPAAQGAAFGGIIAVQLLPSLILGPLGGVLADRFDRRRTMAAMDVARFLLYASIPLAGSLLSQPSMIVAWVAVASFLAQSAAMVWSPAKEAAVPNLIPGARLEVANQLTIATTYGVTPVLAALAFAGLARLPSIGRTDATAFALYFDAVTFLASAAVVWFGVREISGRDEGVPVRERAGRALATGWRYLSGTPLLRGLVVGPEPFSCLPCRCPAVWSAWDRLAGCSSASIRFLWRAAGSCFSSRAPRVSRSVWRRCGRWTTARAFPCCWTFGER